MNQPPDLTIRNADPSDDALIARHFLAMWRDNGVSDDAIHGDGEARARAFVEDARAQLDYQAFIAKVVDGSGGGPGHKVVGSAGAQRFDGLYPNVLTAEHRLYGYVWGVYVEPDWRCRGIARRLTEAAVDHLRAIGCSRVLLHSSPHGRSVYEKLGFEPTNEMGRMLR